MKTFRIITDKYNWTITDPSPDATVFISNHFYKSSTSNLNFIVIDNATIALNKIIAIEVVNG